jgi:hypothetical protein
MARREDTRRYVVRDANNQALAYIWDYAFVAEPWLQSRRGRYRPRRSGLLVEVKHRGTSLGWFQTRIHLHLFRFVPVGSLTILWKH